MRPEALIVGVLAWSVAGCGGAAPARPERTPNLVLLTIDTLRADHLEAYGYGRETAPTLARLADSGVRYAHAVSQAPWTLPSMASVHSGLYPLQHGAVAAQTALPDAIETLAERLAAVGYETVAVVSHDFVTARHGFRQGFKVFDESNVADHDEVTSRELTLTALTLMSEVDTPFFLWVHYFDPHFTYVRHPEIGFGDRYTGALPEQLTHAGLSAQESGETRMADDDLAYVEAVYDEEIAFTDAWIGRLLAGIEERYGVDDTVIVVTADHGEYFLERGRFFHGRDVYGELVDVPLLISGSVDPELRGTVVQAAVETRSIPRTIMGLLQLPANEFGGADLLRIARGDEANGAITEGSYASGTDGRQVGVQRGEFKLIQRLDDDSYELYDLRADPDERTDLFGVYGEGHEFVRPLMVQLAGWRTLPRVEPQPVGLSGGVLERLRSLGYIR